MKIFYEIMKSLVTPFTVKNFPVWKDKLNDHPMFYIFAIPPPYFKDFIYLTAYKQVE